jgi:hypothetical protein
MVNLYRDFTVRISADTADNFPSNDNIYLSFELTYTIWIASNAAKNILFLAIEELSLLDTLRYKIQAGWSFFFHSE